MFDRRGAKAIGSVRLSAGPSGETKLFFVDLQSGKVTSKKTFPLSDAVVCDVNSDGTLLLTKSNTMSRDSRVDVWRLQDQAIQHQASWVLPAQSEMFQVPEFVSFTYDDKVVSLNRGGHLVIWDLDPVKPVAKFKTDYRFSSFTRNSYQISDDRKYLYCILNGTDERPSQLVTFDLVMHECVGKTELDNRNNSLAVAPSGKRAAILGRGVLTVLDHRANVVDEMSADFEGFRDSMRWLDDRFLAIRRAATVTVFDTVSRVPLWSYQARGLITMGELGSHNMVVDAHGRIWISNSPGQKAQVTAFQIPHEDAKANIPDDPDSLLLFKEGMTISIDLRIKGLHKKVLEKIRKHFEKELRSHGLEVVAVGSREDLQLSASSELGESQKTVYENIQARPETVTTRSTHLNVQIHDKDGLAWQRLGSSGGEPMPVILLRKGQSAQSAAGGSFTSERFFLETKFPKHVVRQPPGGAFGFSQIEKGQLIHQPK